MQVGDTAPMFCAPTQQGTEFCLQQVLGKQVVVLYFYPQDGTPVCTAQACRFRDAYEDFVAAGAIVVGVSSNNTSSHQQFAERNRLPFTLLSDSNGKLRQLYEVPNTLGIFPGRVTYVIDKAGIIQLIHNAQLQADSHVQQALEVVQKLVVS